MSTKILEQLTDIQEQPIEGNNQSLHNIQTVSVFPLIMLFVYLLTIIGKRFDGFLDNTARWGKVASKAISAAEEEGLIPDTDLDRWLFIVSSQYLNKHTKLTITPEQLVTLLKQRPNYVAELFDTPSEQVEQYIVGNIEQQQQYDH